MIYDFSGDELPKDDTGKLLDELCEIEDEDGFIPYKPFLDKLCGKAQKLNPKMKEKTKKLNFKKKISRDIFTPFQTALIAQNIQPEDDLRMI